MSLGPVTRPSLNEPSPDSLSPSSNTDDSTTEGSSSDDLPKTLFKRVEVLLRNMTIEPMLFLQMIAMSSTAVNVQSFYIETICRSTYVNESIDCSNLTAYEHEEKYVEGRAAVYSTYRNLIEAGLPIIFSLFLGPWSDKHGSKIPMIIPLIGYTTSAFLYYIFSYAKNLEPAWLLFASVPVALSGGMIAFILSAFRYVASITTVENRSFRMAVAEGSWFLGSPIGLMGSAALLKAGGYASIFVACIILYGLALFYVVIFVKSDKPEADESGPQSNMFRDMFNVEAVKETILTCFRKRNGSRRIWIVLLIITICLRVITLFGSMNTTLLYTRQKFQWDNAMYSTYTTIDGVLGITGSSVVAILGMRVFNIRDTTIGVFSAASYLGGSIIWAMASAGWMMYLGATVQMFCGLITIMIRSMLSKIVSKDELGKVYSFVASGEAAMPLIAAPLYNLVYSSTVSTFPGAVYLMSTGFNLLILLAFIYFFFSIRQHPTHDELLEEEFPVEVNA